MKVTLLREPQLEFANGARHIDPRHGLTDYGPVDAADPSVRVLRVGMIGTRQALDGLHNWLDRCRSPIASKPSHLGHLFVPWPGFDTGSAFRASLVFDGRLERTLKERDIKALEGLSPRDAVNRAVALYEAELEALDEEPQCDVILVARPDVLPERAESRSDHRGPAAPIAASDNFRARLKAVSLRYSRPIQVIRRSTWDPTYREPAEQRERSLQDEATRAWNLHAALYYKAGGIPWRLPKDPGDLTTCYVGITFYRATDSQTLQTSVAQVFNQRGDGVIVRGGAASAPSRDRQPHLTVREARTLLTESLRRYRIEHRNMPARLVLHKTSSYSPEESRGFLEAATEVDIDTIEMIWIPGRDPVRLLRTAEHPPLRGTLLSLTPNQHVLYTRGSVPFYATYPGMYIPNALGFRPEIAESSAEALAVELLALTKMNWNQTQLDGRLPITLRTADRVGEILRHVSPSDTPQGRYAFYM